MITTVTLNAAIDKTYYVPYFSFNQINRISDIYSEAGGKGINVAKVLKKLNLPVTATGIVGGVNGKYILDQLNRLGINHHFVHIEDESRLCINLIDSQQKTQTELLETGPVLSESAWQDIQKLVGQLSLQSRYVVLSGSLPNGLPIDAYAQLIRIIHNNDAKVALDTSGSALKAALEEKHDIIKPNRQEFAQLYQQNTILNKDIVEKLREWNELGSSLIVVSLGQEGAIVSDRGILYQVTSPEIEVINPVGCGDSFVAGMIAGLYLDTGIEDSLRLGTSVAAATALEPRAGYFDKDKVESLKKEIKIRRI